MSTFIIQITVFFESICVFKVIDNQDNKLRPMTNLDFRYKNIKMLCNFRQTLELRITFASCRKFMTYSYYIKPPMPMCEIKLNQHLARNPELIHLI